MSRVGVVLVGQTPPPVHGQALAIERLVRAEWKRIEVHHVRMDFSRTIEDVGRASPRKLLHLVGTVVRTIRVRFTTGARILYYPPAGPMLVPVLRDIAFLLAVRPFFHSVVFECHAGGTLEIRRRLRWPVRWLFDRAYRTADLVIERYGDLREPARLPARQRTTIPYGLPDEARSRSLPPRDDGTLRLLYVGLLDPGKGLWTLLDALGSLKDEGVEFHATLVGEASSPEIGAEILHRAKQRSIGERIRLTGRLEGVAKWREFEVANAFCFVSHYRNEAFPLVILEAMQFGLPVVASRWRGIPKMVMDGESGFLVPPKDAPRTAEMLRRLSTDGELRASMGRKGREIYLRRFTMDRYLEAIEEAVMNVAPSRQGVSA